MTPEAATAHLVAHLRCGYAPADVIAPRAGVDEVDLRRGLEAAARRGLVVRRVMPHCYHERNGGYGMGGSYRKVAQFTTLDAYREAEAAEKNRADAIRRRVADAVAALTDLAGPVDGQPGRLGNSMWEVRLPLGVAENLVRRLAEAQ